MPSVPEPVLHCGAPPLGHVECSADRKAKIKVPTETKEIKEQT